jgi:hypothetical protein
MEYFAAWNLAATSDTPGDFANKLDALVRSVSWHVVGELAVKIKSDISDRGADRIYAALLDLAAADPGESGEVLAFLAKCIESARPSQTTVRLLTRAILDYLFSGHVLRVWSTKRDDSFGAQPVSLLINRSGSYYSVVDAEISARLAEMITSGDEGARTDALLFIAEVGWGSNQALAAQWRKSLLSRYSAEFLAEATTDVRLRIMALAVGVISARQVLAMPGGFSTLLQETVMKFSAVHVSARLPWLCQDGSDNDTIKQLTAIGQYLVEHPTLPWARLNSSSEASVYLPTSYSDPFHTMYDDEQVDETSGLAVAATIAIVVEVANIDRNASVALDYPVPPQFRKIFTMWEAGQINLIEIIEE